MDLRSDLSDPSLLCPFETVPYWSWKLKGSSKGSLSYPTGSDAEGDPEEVVVTALGEEEAKQVPFFPQIPASCHSQRAQELLRHIADPADLADRQGSYEIHDGLPGALELELAIGLVSIRTNFGQHPYYVK